VKFMKFTISRFFAEAGRARRAEVRERGTAAAGLATGIGQA
jgi:hypothetical protein